MNRSVRIGALIIAAVFALRVTPSHAGPPPEGPFFTEVAADIGLNYRHMNRSEGEFCPIPPGADRGNCDCIVDPRGDGTCTIDRIPGGAAVGDYNGDGLDDLYVTRLEQQDILFQNMGDGTFVDVTEEAGLGGIRNANGAGWTDIDNDGDLDLVLSGYWEPRHFLFVNDGTGHFSEEGRARGFTPFLFKPVLGQSVAFGDYDKDGWTDVFIAEWRMAGTGAIIRGPYRSRLYRNLGEIKPGHFQDVTRLAGVQMPDSANFGAAFVDLDKDGWLDLTTSADWGTGTSRLFWNDGDGAFTNGTRDAGVGTEDNGMGLTFGDYDNNGYLDWFATAIAGWNRPDDDPEGNRLSRNDGNRMFSDQTEQKDVLFGYWGWGAAFNDYDNDGDLDLFMTNGFREPVDTTTPFYNDPTRFWVNHGDGAMEERSQEIGLTFEEDGRGVLLFDFDDDGDQDVFVFTNGNEPRVYRNDGGDDNNWLRIRFTGDARPFEGLGAQITLTAEAGGPIQYRELGVATHFVAQSERVAHFGLGADVDTVHKVEVVWPRTGIVQEFWNVAANQTFVITAPDEEVNFSVRKFTRFGCASTPDGSAVTETTESAAIALVLVGLLLCLRRRLN